MTRNTSGGGPLRQVIVFNLIPLAVAETGLPSSFRLQLFDRAVALEKDARARGANAHAAACQRLRDWLEGRDGLTDEQFWEGLRERFLPCGEVTIDGKSYAQSDRIPLSQAEFDAADVAGRVAMHGNQQWTNLARSASRALGDLTALRRAVDLVLADEEPYEDRLRALMDEPIRVPGWGMAHWTALHAMAGGWSDPVMNTTVRDAFDRLGWNLPDWETELLVKDLKERSPALMARAGGSRSGTKP